MGGLFWRFRKLFSGARREHNYEELPYHDSSLTHEYLDNLGGPLLSPLLVSQLVEGDAHSL